MQVLAYSVYDRKALVYGAPFFAPTDGSAIRSFADLSNDINTTVGRHPSDFVLYCVGVYDDQNGALAPVSPLRHVIDATACIVVQPKLPIESFADTQDHLQQRGWLNGKGE